MGDHMICKKCGHDNERVWYEAVMPPSSAVGPSDAEVPDEMEKVYKRWACARCGRYHFADGSLYSNPFKVAK